MTGSKRSSEGLDSRRRKLLFRSWHRGIREMDLIMGRFADFCIGELPDHDLDAYERLLQVPDHDLYAWVVGDGKAPPEYDTALFRKLCLFHRHSAGHA